MLACGGAGGALPYAAGYLELTPLDELVLSYPLALFGGYDDADDEP